MKRLKSNLTVLAAVIAAMKFPAVAVAISVGWLLFMLLESITQWIRKHLHRASPALELR